MNKDFAITQTDGQDRSTAYDFRNWRVSIDTVIPRVNELKPDVKVSGFTPERTVFVRELMEATGLPLDRVTSVSYKPNSLGTEHTLGQARIKTGELWFYKNMDALPPYALEVSQYEVVVHELMHINTPFHAGNEIAYGGRENMRQAAENAILVAVQTDNSRSFLSGYHKALYKELLEGKLAGGQQTFIEETQTILMEQWMVNEKHVRQVLEAQNPNTVDQITAQLDQNLLNLMPQFNNIGEIKQHLANLKKTLIENSKRQNNKLN
ncbi:MAG: hypothetical protein WA152_02620 [Microgenomates group bacterium]